MVTGGGVASEPLGLVDVAGGVQDAGNCGVPDVVRADVLPVVDVGVAGQAPDGAVSVAAVPTGASIR